VRDLHKLGEYSPRNAVEIKKEENLLMTRQWLIKLTNTNKFGTRTVNAILPSYHKWFDRRHGSLEFHLTQILIGHGCFGTYLDRIQKAESLLCMSCREGIIDSPEHTISSCTRWRDERDTLTRIIGIDLDLPTIIKKMLDSKEAWKAMIAFSKE